MAVQQEIWTKYIIDRLWKDNSFLQFAFNEDQYVVGGRIVHIPQPGAKPSVVKNRNVFPAAAVRRTDTDITYVLDEYTTDPAHIQDAEKVELSYDKIASVFGDHAGQITETIAEDILIKWLTGLGTDNIVTTSGALADVKVLGQTGQRKVFTHRDLRKGQLAFNLQGVDKKGRCGLLESNMMDELVESLSDTQYRQFSEYVDAKNGVVGRLYGFDLMDRATVGMSSSANAINPLGSAISATDKTVSMLWQKDAITRALGEKKFFEKKDDPQYFGDIYSALIRMGGRRRRADDKGVIAIMQGV